VERSQPSSELAGCFQLFAIKDKETLLIRQGCEGINMNHCLVRAYQPNNWVHIAPLLAEWPFKPLARHDLWPQARLLNYTCERVQGALGDESGAHWVALQHGEARGFACLTMLPWESEQLGITAARVDYLIADGSYDEQLQIKEALLEQVQMEAHDRGVWHLSARSDSSDLSSLHALEGAGFITVDTVVSVALDLATHEFPAPPAEFQIRLATADDAEHMAALARTAFVVDRFHADPFISPERAGELHAAWLRNSCTSQADAVVLAEDATGALGFVSCTVQRETRKQLGRLVGTISLLASAEHARRRGVGYALIMNGLNWFREQGCEIVDSGTQVRNLAALALFQKCGFRIVGSSLALRRLV
jgi:ribosomal protein S18 acetylase RimI-like enzyme